jgi:hypothetical protein
MSEHSGVTGKTPRQVAPAESLREITDAEIVRSAIHPPAAAPIKSPIRRSSG